MTSFSIEGEDELFHGHGWAVHRVHVVAPDGERFQREVIRHRGAVGVLPLHDDGTVTLVRQFRAALGVDVLEVPAGLRDVDGEDPLTTAQRELAEEVGLRAGTVELLCRFHNAVGMSDEEVHVYLATELTSVAVDLQGVEEQHMTVERIPLDDLVARIDAGEVTDAKTVIGATFAARRPR